MKGRSMLFSPAARRRPSVLLPVLLLCAAGCVTAPGDAAVQPARDEVTLHLLLTSDLHGQLRAEPVGPPGPARLQLGGAAILGGYVGNLRRQAPHRVILLDGGDALSGSLEADMTLGRQVVEVYRLLGYDAMALGNHELDFGRVALQANAARAGFPLLAANVIETATGKPWTAPGIQPTVLLERSGLLVGVLGLATTETPSTTKRSNVEGLTFQELAPVAEAQARKLREQGAQAVVLLAHEGGNCKENEEFDDLSSCETEAPLFRLARALPPDTVDLIAGGHSHGLVAKRVAGMPVIVPGAHGRWLGRVDLVVSRARGRVLVERTVIHPLLPLCDRLLPGSDDCRAPRPPAAAGGSSAPAPAPAEASPSPGDPAPARYAGEEVRPDVAMQQALDPVFAAVERQKERRLGAEAATPLTRSYRTESELGNLICDAMLWAVPEAQVALTNAGGIRADVDAGPITFGEVYQVLPFDNRLALLTLSGAQLQELVTIGLNPRHGLEQVGGLRITGRIAEEPARRLVSLQLADGSPVLPQVTYRVVTTDYLATGGSGYHQVTRTLPPEATEIREARLRDVVAAYLEEMGKKGLTVDPPDRPLLDPARPRLRLLDDGAKAESQ
ncbi:MAG: bifunctional metallophosphatase/5'-nucleotidase [Deltaproteobacteria bacterium]|nr:bifunctional metallophosphatase/5'-nucleotidase [Deltaproteobacteria bacterium]